MLIVPQIRYIGLSYDPLNYFVGYSKPVEVHSKTATKGMPDVPIVAFAEGNDGLHRGFGSACAAVDSM